MTEDNSGRVPTAPGSHPTGHAASGVDGASRFDPSRDNRPPKKFYDAAETNDALVWRICEYHHEDCKKCPSWQDEPGHGKCKIGCRAIAEEMIALVLATCDSDGSRDGRDREDGLDGEAATARAEGIAQ
jgi:hypothetical protein